MKIARSVMPALVPALLLAIGVPGSSRAQDPPDRVGRLSFIGGDVSFRPGGEDEWTAATLNYPLTTGDELWAEAGARAEITLGSAAIRLARSTAAGFLTLDDQMTQIRLSQGSLQVRLRDFADDETFEIDTPNGAVRLLQTGSYRVDVDARGYATTLTVREGRAELTAAGSSLSVQDDEAATVYDIDSPSYDMRTPRPADEWERWAALRDRRLDDSPSARYVSRDMPGYEDLDDNGDWHQTPEYGAVWVPRHVVAGWSPYRNGHWAWIEPWGWTWIDDAPWGFAPYHYGRWVYMGRGWAWVPGHFVARPVYAPALVVFVGGSSWNVSIGLGGGVGWFPLGPDEVYVPVYHVSDRYVRRINNAPVNITLADMTNVRYRNRTSPGGVTVVTRETFVGARPVGRSLIVVPRDKMNRAPVVGTAAPFAPTRESVAHQGGRPVGRPPEVVTTRRVVVRTAPPPQRVPFTTRERMLQAHPGRPLDDATLTTLREGTPTKERPIYRPATRGEGPELKPSRGGLPEAHPANGEPGNRGRRQGERPQPEPRPPVEPRQPADRVSPPPLPTPPRLPAEQPGPAKPPAPPPQDRGRHPQPEQRPPVTPATPEDHKPAEPPAKPPKDDRGHQPQPEQRPPAAATPEQPKAAEPPAPPPKNEKGWRRSVPKPPQDSSSGNPR
jgi:hypothetical protein